MSSSVSSPRRVLSHWKQAISMSHLFSLPALPAVMTPSSRFSISAGANSLTSLLVALNEGIYGLSVLISHNSALWLNTATPSFLASSRFLLGNTFFLLHERLTDYNIDIFTSSQDQIGFAVSHLWLQS